MRRHEERKNWPWAVSVSDVAPCARRAANLAAILVFNEPIGSSPLQIGARSIAFCLVIIGAALIPTHAEQLEPDESDAERARDCGPSPCD